MRDQPKRFFEKPKKVTKNLFHSPETLHGKFVKIPDFLMLDGEKNEAVGIFREEGLLGGGGHFWVAVREGTEWLKRR